MSDLNRRALQPIYDYCRSCLPQFALAIREADDEIERLEAVVDAAKEIADDYEAYESRGDCSGIYDVPVHDVQILAKWKAALAALEEDEGK